MFRYTKNPKNIKTGKDGLLKLYFKAEKDGKRRL